MIVLRVTLGDDHERLPDRRHRHPDAALRRLQAQGPALIATPRRRVPRARRRVEVIEGDWKPSASCCSLSRPRGDPRILDDPDYKPLPICDIREPMVAVDATEAAAALAIATRRRAHRAQAGRVALDYFRNRDRLVVELKGPSDYVSHADRDVENIIRRELAAAFPDDTFLGEETAAAFDGTGGSLLGRRPDRRHAQFPARHAVLERRRSASSRAAHAGRRRLRSARRCALPRAARRRRVLPGGGTARRRCARLPTQRGVRQPTSCWAITIARSSALLRHPAAHDGAGIAMRNFGSAALQLAHVASGRLDGFIELQLSCVGCRGRPAARGGSGRLSRAVRAARRRRRRRMCVACAPGRSPTRAGRAVASCARPKAALFLVEIAGERVRELARLEILAQHRVDVRRRQLRDRRVHGAEIANVRPR